VSVETFDPHAVDRLAAAVLEAEAAGASFATARTEDLQQLLSQLDYAKASRLTIADGAARLRSRVDDVVGQRDEARTIARRLWSASVSGEDDPLGQRLCPDAAPPWLTSRIPEKPAVSAVSDIEAALKRAESLTMCGRCRNAVAVYSTRQGHFCAMCRDAVYPSDAIPADVKAEA
jgi:hypothetical protein